MTTEKVLARTKTTVYYRRFKDMKKSISLFLAAGLVIALVGCGGQNAGISEGTTQQAESKSENSSEVTEKSNEGSTNTENISLRFAWWGGEERHQATLEAIKKYEELNPNVKIEAEYSGFDGYQQKLITQLSGNSAADIVQVDQPWLPDLANQGDLLLDLSKEETLDLSAFDDEFLNNTAVIDGKLLGIPTGVNTNALLYNKAFTEKFELDMSDTWTWDELMKYGKKIHEENPDYYLINTNAGMAGSVLSWYLEQETGKYWITDDYTLQYTKEDWTNALNMFKQWIDNGIIEPMEVSSVYESKPSENPTWINGLSGTILNWVSDRSGMSMDGTLDIHIGSVPCNEGAIGTGIVLRPSQIFSIPSSCQHKEEAVKFLDWLMNDEEAITILKDVRGVPASSKAREILVEKKLLLDESVAAVDRSLEIGAMKIPNISTGETESVLIEILQEVGFGLSSPEEGADKLMSEYEKIIDELKAK